MRSLIRLVKYGFTAKEERDTATSTPMIAGNYGHFPQSFSLYYVGEGKDYWSQKFFIGERPSEQLNAVTYHTGPGFHQMTLYESPEREPPILGIATNEKRYASSAEIQLPPPEKAEGDPKIEQLKYARMSDVHSFTMDVGNGSGQQTEKFEWHQKREAITTRTLVRASGGGGAQPLARWTEGRIPARDGKVATFTFLDEDAAEELGRRWILMAVVSALRVCQYHGSALIGAEEMEKELKISFNYDKERDNNAEAALTQSKVWRDNFGYKEGTAGHKRSVAS